MSTLLTILSETDSYTTHQNLVEELIGRECLDIRLIIWTMESALCARCASTGRQGN